MYFSYKTGLVFLLSLLLISCGTDKKFGDNKGLTTDVILKAVLNQIMDESSVLGTSLKRQDGTGIENARVALSFTQGPFTVFADEATSNDLGLAGNSVSKLTYAYSVTNLPEGVGEITASRSISITGTSADKFQTSSVPQEITGDGLSSLQVDYFRSSSAGLALDFTQPVLRLSLDSITNASAIVTAELFSGFYRTRVQAESNNGSVLMTQLSDAFTVVGNGAVAAQFTTALGTGFKSLDLSLQDNNGLSIQGQANANLAANDVRIIVYDMDTAIEIARQKVDVNGRAVINIIQDDDADTSNDINNILALIVDFSSPNNAALNADTDVPLSILGVYKNSAFTSDDVQTLTQSLVSGELQLPATESLDANDSADILVTINDMPSAFLNKFNRLETVSTLVGDAAFELKLFNGSYQINASSVLGFPMQTEQNLEIADANLNVSLAVDVGGQLSGLISDQNNMPLAGISVSVFPLNSLSAAATPAIVEMITAVDGLYSFDLAAGNYDLWVNGAVTENISVVQSQAMQQNINSFNVSGRAVDVNKKSVENMDVFIIHGDSTVQTNGAFTLRVFEGLNALCYRPPQSRTDLGLECHFNVLVDQLAVDAL